MLVKITLTILMVKQQLEVDGEALELTKIGTEMF